MSLKTRKVRTMLEEYSDQCIKNFNQILGTNFEFEINWEIISPYAADSPWDDSKYQKSFLANYFNPFEVAFTELFKDDMYKEAINEQVKKIVIEPGQKGLISWNFENGTLTCSHEFNRTFTDIEKDAINFTSGCVKALTKTLEEGLK